ncbi:purple acid phosphatase family protein [Cecembia rubra]|uniref:Purple acid phosphatase-like protein n=1 Tax=Cecembia rubra TaxID=1485585 RepID=A0A2P8DXJ4_9BACT|nr:metallophosphoesterase family protein [Cecembia rubra]PSL01936.1 purple acid phosphatase-like protein [Cecembia rubra]
MNKLILSSFTLIFFVFTAVSQAQNAPYAFYLTWNQDPTTSMVVDWHSDGLQSQQLNIRRKGTANWSQMESDVLPYPFSERVVHRVSLLNLRPDTAYEIQFPGSNEVYYFSTMPSNLNEKSIKIAIGGDAMHRKEWFEKTNRVVSFFEPDFVIIGGDMAYENGIAENIQRIYDWFEGYSNTLITADNRILPCVVAIGNHEVVGGYYSRNPGYEQNNSFRKRIAPYFYGLFAFPGQPGYNVLDFGDYLSLIILDTEHSNPIPGVQTQWLAKTLEERTHVLHRIPIYHVPGFPSVRNYEDITQTMVREHWVPLFEKSGVRIAFENHDHAYKRTYPIRNLQRDQSGVIYVGDGSWGVGERPIHDVENTWYLKRAQSVKAFTLLTLEGPQFNLISVDENGRIIDSYPESPLPYRSH